MHPPASQVTEPTALDGARIQRLSPYLSLMMVGRYILQLKRTATYAVINRPDFPRPIELGGRHRVWVTSEVIEWVERQPRRSSRQMPQSLAAARRHRDSQLTTKPKVKAG